MDGVERRGKLVSARSKFAAASEAKWVESIPAANDEPTAADVGAFNGRSICKESRGLNGLQSVLPCCRCFSVRAKAGLAHRCNVVGSEGHGSREEITVSSRPGEPGDPNAKIEGSPAAGAKRRQLSQVNAMDNEATTTKGHNHATRLNTAARPAVAARAIWIGGVSSLRYTAGNDAARRGNQTAQPVRTRPDPLTQDTGHDGQ
jgi:hypothetical protein